MRNTLRADIQALRAIAVLGVVVWHLDNDALGGGFTGVDVFFVISGYLMTRTLMQEERIGVREALAFWGRRCRRILPAASVTIIVALVGAWIFLPSTSRLLAANESIWAGSYLINWRLARDSVDYLASLEAPSHLQHFWSLAVEEQFYLLWPILLGITLWAAIRLGRNTQRTVTVVIGCVVLASLVWSMVATAAASSAAYFSTFTRLWELALGGLIVLLPALTRGIAAMAGLVGLAGIGTAFVWLPSTAPFPGLIALWPTVATALVIWAGVGHDRSAVGRLLGARWIQWIGDISYSLYLWHWPVLIFLNPYDKPQSLWSWHSLVVAALSFALAALSWRYVERPFRVRVDTTSRASVFRALRLGAACLVAVALVAVPLRQVAPAFSAPANYGGAPDAVLGASALARADYSPEADLTSGQFVPAPDDIVADLPFTYEAGCHVPIAESAPLACDAGSLDADAMTIALVGDSHAAQWVPAFESLADAFGWHLTIMTKSSCPFVDAAVSYAESDAAFVECSRWNDNVLSVLLADKPDLVVTSNAATPVWNGQASLTGSAANEPLAEGLASTWTQLIDAGIDVAVIRDIPVPGFSITSCVASEARSLAACEFDRATAMQDSANGQSVALQLEPRAHQIDVTDYICPGSVCEPVVGGVVVYRDRSHLTSTYVETLAPFLGSALDEAGVVTT